MSYLLGIKMPEDQGGKVVLYDFPSKVERSIYMESVPSGISLAHPWHPEKKTKKKKSKAKTIK